jgi:peptide/nickel transport system substrate-binding protein
VAGGALRLRLVADEVAEADPESAPAILLRGEPAPRAVARFASGSAQLVTGGTAGDLPLARAVELPGAALRFDPVNGLFGLAFSRAEGLLADAGVRRALNMAIDRPALVAALGVPGLGPRTSIVPLGVDELPQPVSPAWDPLPLPERQRQARALIAAAGEDRPTLRVAMPAGPGYRLLFAHLWRDWRAIGIEAERVADPKQAHLRLIDEVAPALLASWYLRRFTCEASAVCSAEADSLLAAAREAPALADRQARLADADRVLIELGPFIPLTAPVRWSLVSPRMTGFQPHPFAVRFPGSLVAAGRRAS